MTTTDTPDLPLPALLEKPAKASLAWVQSLISELPHLKDNSHLNALLQYFSDAKRTSFKVLPLKFMSAKLLVKSSKYLLRFQIDAEAINDLPKYDFHLHLAYLGRLPQFTGTEFSVELDHPQSTLF